MKYIIVGTHVCFIIAVIIIYIKTHKDSKKIIKEIKEANIDIELCFISLRLHYCLMNNNPESFYKVYEKETDDIGNMYYQGMYMGNFKEVFKEQVDSYNEICVPICRI